MNFSNSLKCIVLPKKAPTLITFQTENAITINKKQLKPNFSINNLRYTIRGFQQRKIV